MPDDVNLASESNAAKINQRFKELEEEISELKSQIQTIAGNQGNLTLLVQEQTNMIQQAWVNHYGNGPTETG